MVAVFKERAFAIHTINAAVTVAGAEYGKVNIFNTFTFAITFLLNMGYFENWKGIQLKLLAFSELLAIHTTLFIISPRVNSFYFSFMLMSSHFPFCFFNQYFLFLL